MVQMVEMDARLRGYTIERWLRTGVTNNPHFFMASWLTAPGGYTVVFSWYDTEPGCRVTEHS
jgi:hypothetical protein